MEGWLIPKNLVEKVYFDKLAFTQVGNKELFLGGSHGQVVMGGDWCSQGCEFKSQHRILDGHFSHLFVVRFVMFV